MADFSDLAAPSLFNVKGWTALVTGGGTGLGLMAARTLAANGVRVYITGRRADKLKDAEMSDSATGGSITGMQMDVTDKASVQECARALAAKEKCLNLLVNNAGMTSKNYATTGGPREMPTGTPQQIADKMLEYQDFDEWSALYKANVAGVFMTSIAFLPLLCAARDQGYAEAGSVVNVSSISGITKTSQGGQFNYNASKAAAISLTEQLAVDLKAPGLEIRVNTIAPGYFPSEMTPVAGEKGMPKEHFRENWGVPFGRAGDPRDYAQALLNFAVNKYTTGSTHVIDGGWLLAHP